jgi:hypothetical protein
MAERQRPPTCRAPPTSPRLPAVSSASSWPGFPRARRGDRAGQEDLRRLPHQLGCRQFFVATPDLLGIWGGTSALERRRLRRDAGMTDQATGRPVA